MVTIFWNPTGFDRIGVLLKGMKFNADYHSFHILDPFAQRQRSQLGGSDRPLNVHTDNARRHTAKMVTEFLAGNGMKKAPHPPYSLDLAPCDFHLCGHSKGMLAGVSFEEPNQLLSVIDAIFQSSESHIRMRASGVDEHVAQY
jgi:hypothetical protein